MNIMGNLRILRRRHMDLSSKQAYLVPAYVQLAGFEHAIAVKG